MQFCNCIEEYNYLGLCLKTNEATGVPVSSTKGNAESCSLGLITQQRLGINQLESSLVEKDLESW